MDGLVGGWKNPGFSPLPKTSPLPLWTLIHHFDCTHPRFILFRAAPYHHTIIPYHTEARTQSLLRTRKARATSPDVSRAVATAVAASQVTRACLVADANVLMLMMSCNKETDNLAVVV